MDIHLEAIELHTIQAYSPHEIQINSIIYTHSFIVSKTEIIRDLSIRDIQQIDELCISQVTQLKPEIILIGQEQSEKRLPLSMMQHLSQQRIGVECMSIGAACRTYNVLLSERRGVVGFFIL